MAPRILQNFLDRVFNDEPPYDNFDAEPSDINLVEHDDPKLAADTDKGDEESTTPDDLVRRFQP